LSDGRVEGECRADAADPMGVVRMRRRVLPTDHGCAQWPAVHDKPLQHWAPVMQAWPSTEHPVAVVQVPAPAPTARLQREPAQQSASAVHVPPALMQADPHTY